MDQLFADPMKVELLPATAAAYCEDCSAKLSTLWALAGFPAAPMSRPIVWMVHAWTEVASVDVIAIGISTSRKRKTLGKARVCMFSRNVTEVI